MEPNRRTLDAELIAPGLLHELRQPLAGAEALAILLERDQRGLAGLPDWRVLRGQLSRLRELVDGYEEVFVAGVSAAVDYEVLPVVLRASSLLSHRLRPLEGRFAFQGPAAPVPAHGTPGALVHAVTNLVANALDALDAAGAAGERAPRRIAVRVLDAPGGRPWVEVRVSDEGRGVPEALRRRLFEPRFTTKTPGRGNGLGLHLSRVLVERDGGELFLVDERDPLRLPWASAEFCVALPRGGQP